MGLGEDETLQATGCQQTIFIYFIYVLFGYLNLTN